MIKKEVERTMMSNMADIVFAATPDIGTAWVIGVIGEVTGALLGMTVIT